jgi:hypothetical protein
MDVSTTKRKIKFDVDENCKSSNLFFVVLQDQEFNSFSVCEDCSEYHPRAQYAQTNVFLQNER